MTVPRNYSIKRVANIQLSELRKYDWWRRYESGPKCRPRIAVINGLKSLFPEWDMNPTFNFHWDKRRQLENIKLYIHVPKVVKVEIKHEGERQGEIPVVRNAVLRHPPVLD